MARPEAGRRAAVLGHPIAHSLSPVLHGAAYRALGLDWAYDAIDVTPADLANFLAALDDAWVGLSLTMPLKRAVLPLLDDVDDLAWATGAANTVVAGPRLVGLNTDVYGIIAAIREVLRHGSPDAAVVLGAGATAASALAALRELGCRDLTVLARREDDLSDLDAAAQRLKVVAKTGDLALASTYLPDADLVISTVPAHAADGLAAQLTAADGVLLDVVYDPRPSDLLAAWSALGGAIVPGERMLLHQAALQVEYFTKQTAPIALMDQALREALEK